MQIAKKIGDNLYQLEIGGKEYVYEVDFPQMAGEAKDTPSETQYCIRAKYRCTDEFGLYNVEDYMTPNEFHEALSRLEKKIIEKVKSQNKEV